MSGNDWHFSVAQFLLPKEGLLPSECEDAIALSLRQKRFCVSDGATEAYDSRRWARLLTRCWAISGHLLTKEEFEPWLSVMGERLQRRWSRKALPWYAEEKARGGAFAAFVPISEPAAFSYHPTLIPSNVQRQQGIGEQFTVAMGGAAHRDSFWLLTDAIAAWFLRMAVEDPSRIDELAQLLDANDTRGFERFVERERADKSLRNDDVAVLRVTIDAPQIPIAAV
jgi:hypothetical protein